MNHRSAYALLFLCACRVPDGVSVTAGRSEGALEFDKSQDRLDTRDNSVFLTLHWDIGERRASRERELAYMDAVLLRWEQKAAHVCPTTIIPEPDPAPGDTYPGPTEPLVPFQAEPDSPPPWFLELKALITAAVSALGGIYWLLASRGIVPSFKKKPEE